MQVQKENSEKLIVSKSRARLNKLRFLPIADEPTDFQLNYFWVVNFLDMGMSHYYVHNHPNIKEGNPVLPEKPNAGQFILQKTLTAPVIAANSTRNDMTWFNTILTIVVLRNHYLYNTTSRCVGPANYHVDGYNINC